MEDEAAKAILTDLLTFSVADLKKKMAETSRGQHFGCTGETGAEIGVFGMLSSTLLGIHLMVSIISASNENNNNNNNNNVGLFSLSHA